MNPAVLVWKKNLLCTGADGRASTWEAASYGGCHTTQVAQEMHMGLSGASWPLPFPGLLILFAEQLSRETSRQRVSKLTLPEEHADLSLRPWEVISALRAGSPGRRLRSVSPHASRDRFNIQMRSWIWRHLYDYKMSILQWIKEHNYNAYKIPISYFVLVYISFSISRTYCSKLQQIFSI